MFRALGPADVRRIAELELAQVAQRLAARGVRLEVAAAVQAQVCVRGYDQVRGVMFQVQGLGHGAPGRVRRAPGGRRAVQAQVCATSRCAEGISTDFTALRAQGPVQQGQGLAPGTACLVTWQPLNAVP